MNEVQTEPRADQTVAPPTTTPAAPEPGVGQANELLNQGSHDPSTTAPARIGRSTGVAMRTIIRAMVPPEPAPQLDDVELARQMRQILTQMPWLLRIGFGLCLRLIDWSPLWRFRGWRRLRSLPRRVAAQELQLLSESRIASLRHLLISVRTLVLLLYFDQPQVMQAIDYHPGSFVRKRVLLRQRLLAGETSKPGDNIGPHSTEVANDSGL